MLQMACLYRLVVELEHNIVDGEAYDWVIAYGLELNDPLSNYITAMMWSIQTMTTVGYGDVVSVCMWAWHVCQAVHWQAMSC